LTREWDNREAEKAKGMSGFVFFMIMVFAIGFFIGVFWGLSWYEATNIIVPPVFGEEISEYKLFLHDSVGISDTILILSNKT